MKLTQISCEKYKGFRDPIEIELRPLTVVLGKNNSGKSALVRLAPLLAHALSSEADELIDLEVGGVVYGSVFRDLIYGRSPHGELALGARFEEGRQHLAVSAKLQNVVLPTDDREYAVVSEYELAGDVDLHLEWLKTPEDPPRYRELDAVRFEGLLPRVGRRVEVAALEKLEDWRPRLDDFNEKISYLGPLRQTIPRFCRIAPQPPSSSKVGHDGGKTPQILEAYDELLDEVSEWCRRNLDGWRLDLDFSGNHFECVFRRHDSAINAADTGEGMAQVLPVVAQQYLHRVRSSDSSLDIVEHPELHLHPAAHAGLADLYVESVKSTEARVIVETHSENFLLRLRRRIAEGTIEPSQIGLYWVAEEPGGGSTVRRIEISKNGAVDGWPTGVFSESYEEVVALRRAARRRER